MEFHSIIPDEFQYGFMHDVYKHRVPAEMEVHLSELFGKDNRCALNKFEYVWLDVLMAAKEALEEAKFQGENI